MAKASLLQLQRATQNWLHGIRRHPQIRDNRFLDKAVSSSTALWTDPVPSEMWYQRGKIQNLRLAATRLDHCLIPAGEIFSFWAQVGRASSYKGYVRGRMLQEGCMIPAIGGGLCQLSNALYQAALDAGCEIVERHPHSRIVPGSATAERRDATVAWNYIDLRFRAAQPLQLRVRLTPTHLHVALLSASLDGHTVANRPENHSMPLRTLPILSDHACESCGQVSCFRSDHHAFHLKSSPKKAFLVDAAWPEFIRFIETNHTAQMR